MNNTVQDYVEQVTVWLWLQEELPIYWLVGVCVSLLIFIVLNGIRLRRRWRYTDAQREQLAIECAGQAQRIEQLEQDRTEKERALRHQSERVHTLSSQTSELSARLDEKLLRIKNLEHDRAGLREALENDRRKASRLESDVREQNARLNAEKDKLAELKLQFEQQKRELKNEFKLVSEEVIKQRQQTLTEQNREGVSALLKPLQEQIFGFQQRVNQVHDESIKSTASLRAQIDNVQKMGASMQTEANNLTSALKGDSQQRGAWGEAQLERTLELSGLVPHDHYEKQSSFVDDDGRRKQTDYIIKLPEGKCIIIDSKVSLLAYERACSGSAEQQVAAMKMHVAAVRKHINELANKEYTNLADLHCPDFILMFMPIEPAYIEAMKQDSELFAYGYTKNVILVSHTTLVPILRTVANLWMLDRSNKEARMIGEKANDIYSTVATVSERLLRLGKTLNTASTHYNDTVKSIAGIQGLQGKVARFGELSSKASKEMPKLEQKNIEFDTSKLDAQALPETTLNTDNE